MHLTYVKFVFKKQGFRIININEKLFKLSTNLNLSAVDDKEPSISTIKQER